jgi:hypothetical protein
MKPQIALMLILISMNAGIYVLNESGVYPYKQPLETPNQILGNFTLPDLITAGILTLTGIFEIIIRKNTFAGVALIGWSMGFFLQASRWALSGVSEIMKLVGVPSYLVLVASVLSGFIFWLFILELTTQRDMT